MRVRNPPRRAGEYQPIQLRDHTSTAILSIHRGAATTDGLVLDLVASDDRRIFEHVEGLSTSALHHLLRYMQVVRRAAARAGASRSDPRPALESVPRLYVPILTVLVFR
jgi:hypothetical protein